LEVPAHRIHGVELLKRHIRRAVAAVRLLPDRVDPSIRIDFGHNADVHKGTVSQWRVIPLHHYKIANLRLEEIHIDPFALDLVVMAIEVTLVDPSLVVSPFSGIELVQLTIHERLGIEEAVVSMGIEVLNNLIH